MARFFSSTGQVTVRSVLGMSGLASAYGLLVLLFADRAPDAMPYLTVWPPSGLALAACLRFGLRCWTAITLGSVAAHLSLDASLLRVLPLALGETLAPLIGAGATMASLQYTEPFRRVRHTCRFLCYGVLAGPGIGTAASRFGAWMLDAQPMNPPWSEWLSTWLGHATGTVLLAPWLLALSGLRSLPAVSFEYAAHWLATVAFSLFVFVGWLHPDTAHYPMVFLMLPLLVWAGLRFGPLGVSTWLLTVSSIATLSTAYGVGPFVQPLPSVSQPLLAAYVLVVGGTLLILHALAAERTESGDQLRRHRARLQAILDTAADGIVTIDERGRIELFNPAAERMFGHSIDEVIGRNISVLMPEADRESHDRALAGLASSPLDALRRAREVRGLRRDGSVFPVEITIGEHHEDGRRFTGILRDISARRLNESALRESQQRLELALAGVGFGIWDWRVHSGEAVFDERWAGMLGFRVDEIAPNYRSWERLLHPDDRPRILPILNAHLSGKTPYYEAEFRLRTKDGQWKWILARGKVFDRDASGKPLRAVGIHSDISLRVGLEERLRKQQEELLFVHRLTTAGELAGTIAHELNQPLGAIAGYLTGVTRRFRSLLDQHPKLEHALRETERLTQRAADTVAGIRHLVSKHETEAESLDLGALIGTTLALMGPEILRRRVRVESRIQQGLPSVRGQRILLQQLLINLILNALEAMDKVDTGRRRLSVRADPARDGTVEIRVSDTGPGVLPTLAPRLFEPFVSSKPDGMGLGLSICRTIAEKHGGGIRVLAEPSGVTTFSVTLAGLARD